MRKIGIVLLTLLMLSPAQSQAASSWKDEQADYLEIVRAYADCMVEQGRDRYGSEHSPLFAAAMDREGFTPGSFPGVSGIREHDRMTSGANPMHHENLYQLLYALSKATGERKYAREADKALTWFFAHCQSSRTGLMAWGEHIGWDFFEDEMKGRDCCHEFFRPWVLWDTTWELAPGPAEKFALGLWEHQIYDQDTGEFSRHARWSRHGPGRHSEYPRHGGFYIATWAEAYQRTGKPVFLKAIRTLLGYFNERRSERSGAIPAESHNRSKGVMLWPQSNLSLAVDLHSGAGKVPDDLAETMGQSARMTDEVYLKLPHTFGNKGKGFVTQSNIHTLEPTDVRNSGKRLHTRLWATGYGMATDAQVADLCYLRYRQLSDRDLRAGYGRLIVASAVRYLNSEPDLDETIYPGPMGHVIFHMLAAYEITGRQEFLTRADHFARVAVDSFLTDGPPLPKASSRHDHYEAITRADTMMIALLKLWQVKNRPELNLDLTYCDR